MVSIKQQKPATNQIEILCYKENDFDCENV